MTNREFSDTFTTMLNSFNTQAQFGEQASKREIVLDEYEKSVILTQAQDQIVKSYFDGSLNQQGQGFDDSTRRQIDFSSLIKVATLDKEPSSANYSKFDPRGIVYRMPRRSEGDNGTEVLFILNERLEYADTNDPSKDGIYVVVPINYKEYDREMSKPYAQPLKKQAWRLFQNNVSGFDVYSELIPRWNITEGTGKTLVYKIRYVRRPVPIVLEDLPDGLSVDGYTDESSCELNPLLHMDILNRAVELAISTRAAYVQQPQRNNSREQ